MKVAYSKVTGHRIVGTYDLLAATAWIGEWNGRHSDGNLSFEYAGESELHWDTAEQETDGTGQRLFVDENGSLVPEDQIELRDEDETGR